MAAYMIVQNTVTNPEQFSKYRDAVGPLMERFGGKAVVRNVPVEALEGQHDGRRLSMFEFPSIEAIHAFWGSPEYVSVKALRRDAAVIDVWAVAGS